MVEFTGLCETADAEGFVVVFPNGSGRVTESRSWNAGDNLNVYAARHNIDDVGFVDCLLNVLIPQLHVGPGRVYAVGMSNGGLFAYRLAAELSPWIAGVGAVGCAAVNFDLQPSLPVSVIHFHGTDDTYVPYFGGVGDQSLGRIEFKSVPKTVAFWAKHNGCEFPAAQDLLPDAGDGTRIGRHLFTGGDQGSEVHLYTIDGGGHTWPGRPAKYPSLGRSTMQIDANELMWHFFRRFRRKTA
jgi:polyhydroxybutyrate depolymerase